MIKVFNHYFHQRTFAQVLLDMGLIVGALVVVLLWQTTGGGGHDHALSDGISRGLLMALGMFTINSSLGFYDRVYKMSSAQMRARGVLSFIVSVGIIGLMYALLPLEGSYNHVAVLGTMVAITGAMLLHRVLVGETLPTSFTRQKILIYGTGVRARAVGKSLLSSNPNVDMVGYYSSPNESQPEVAEDDIFPANMRLGDVVRQNKVDEIVVALTERRGGSMPMREMLDCKLQGVRVVDIAQHFEQSLGQIRLDSVNAGWLIFGDGFNQGMVRTLIKRLFDIAGASVLLLLASPIMLVTALLIVLESGMPILYRQERVGLNGRVFNVVKFRSMRTDAEKDGVPRWATAGDARVTRVGKVIRKIRVDELPQLFSVLLGHMSLVGPRPERPYFVDQLTQQIPYYAVRHSVKPGVTGWAQVRYQYGATVDDTVQKLQFDLYYVKNHSLFLDLVVLFETVGVVLTGKGAQ